MNNQKILLLCEGSCEKTIIEFLLDADLLNFTRDELLDMQVFNARQLTAPVVYDAIIRYSGPIKVYRVGDKQSDKLKIPKDFEEFINKDGINKYCTKPELELLIIISENKMSEYNKSKLKPSQFVTKYIKCNKNKYQKNYDSLYYFFGGNNVSKLVDSIIEYKRTHKNNDDELYLADLLK